MSAASRRPVSLSFGGYSIGCIQLIYGKRSGRTKHAAAHLHRTRTLAHVSFMCTACACHCMRAHQAHMGMQLSPHKVLIRCCENDA
jgi:hypothetical protein